MIHFRRPEAGPPASEGVRGRGGGQAGRRVPWPGRAFPVAARQAPRQALCSPARLGRLPGPTCLQLWARLSPPNLFFFSV